EPGGAGEELLVGVARRHELNADRQSIRAAVGRQGERGGVENSPDRLEAGIAGFAEAARRLAVGTRREQHVDLLEHGGEPCPAFFPEPPRRDIVGTRHGAPAGDALALPPSQSPARTPPFLPHCLRPLLSCAIAVARTKLLMVSRAAKRRPANSSGRTISCTRAPALASRAAASSTAATVSACADCHSGVRQRPTRGAESATTGAAAGRNSSTALKSSRSSSERAIRPSVSRLSAAGYTPRRLKAPKVGLKPNTPQ